MGFLLLLAWKIFFPVLAPFVLGMLIAALIDPLVETLEHSWKWPRAMAAVFILASVLFGLMAFALFVVNGVYLECRDFLQQLPVISRQGAGFLAYLSKVFSRFQRSVPPEVQRGFFGFVEKGLS